MGLVRLTPDGKLADSLAVPPLPVQSEEYVAAKKVGRGESRISAEVAFAGRSFWTWHPGGYFVIADGSRFRIGSVGRQSKQVVIERNRPPIPVAEAERAEERARIITNLRQLDSSWTWTGSPVPETKAPLAGLVVARDGKIWAQVATPSDKIPPSELPLPNARRPVNSYQSPVAYEIYGEDGRFLGAVTAPTGFLFIEADGDRVWGLVRDADDLPSIVRFRIEPPLAAPER